MLHASLSHSPHLPSQNGEEKNALLALLLIRHSIMLLLLLLIAFFALVRKLNRLEFHSV
jgi:hypothetical protein